MCHENLRVPIFVHACIHQVRLSLQRSDISGRQNETGKTVVPVLRNHVSTTLPQLQIRHLGRIVLSLAFFFSGGFFGGGKSVAMVGETVHAQIPFISRHCDFKQFIFTSPRHFLGKKNTSQVLPANPTGPGGQAPRLFDNNFCFNCSKGNGATNTTRSLPFFVLFLEVASDGKATLLKNHGSPEYPAFHQALFLDSILHILIFFVDGVHSVSCNLPYLPNKKRLPR